MVFHGIRAVIYDLDGTLIDTAGLHEEGWRHAGRKLCVPVTPQMLLEQRGITDSAAAQLMLGEGRDHGRFVSAKHAFVEEHLAAYARLFPRVESTIEALEARGLATGLCTSASKAFLASACTAVPFLARYSAQAVYAGMVPHGKPAPDSLLLCAERLGIAPASGLYVGDAYVDYLASVNAAFAGFVHFLPPGRHPDANFTERIARISSHEDILLLIE